LLIKKPIQVIIKSLVHAVATLNSNMHIKFQVNQIIRGSLYNDTSKTWFQEKHI